MRLKCAIVALVAAALLLVPAGAAADCADASGDRPAELLRAEQPVDAHLLAETLLALCPEAPGAARWRVVDALALDRLDEHERARARLAEAAGGGAEAERAAVLLAWSYLRAGDRSPRLPRPLAPEAAARLATLAAIGDRDAFAARAAGLDAALRDAALRAHDGYRAARGKSPAAAAVLSALLPGAGQAYAGSWPAAATALVLNAVLIGATVELAGHQLYLSAATTGVAASVFYVGNVLNAADLASRANDVASRPAYGALEGLLLPEARP